MDTYRIKAFLKSRKFIVSTLLLVLIVGAATTAIIFLTRPYYMTIFAVGSYIPGTDVEQRRTREFAGSRLWMHNNNTFSFAIYYRGNQELVGIGRWEQNGDQVTFIYTDMFRAVGYELWRDHEHANWTATYTFRRGTLALRCPNNRYFFFRR
ncbi:MAG: hypothetical protein FWC00_04455 [Firmicutes bacterium]|nr:hypothetical protein [Bacillota bacterium]